MKKLVKKAVYDQLQTLITLMDNRGEWSTVQRHLIRASIAVKLIMGEK